MNETKQSYASPISFTRATPFLWSIVSDRSSWWGATLAILLVIPATALLWAGLLVYYLLMFTVFAVPFVVWRLMRRSDRKHRELINAMAYQNRAQWDEWNRQNGGV
jgi:hypothetical protein